ncbi:MAG: ribosome-associated translation inhibitor RaiA [Clostridiales bacterium]|nr:MAG: ribosome-associated translation inhibitor RaiA [Clostridiales bacterium]
MKLTITGKKFTVTDKISEKITEKLKKFDKYFDDEAVGNVVLRSRKNVEIIEITIHYKGTMFRAEVEEETALNALDRAVDIIERQIRKNKTRLERRLKIGAFDKVALADSQWKDAEEEDIRITRTKKFVVKPMTPDEAILQMNLLGHEFFLFNNSLTDDMCVVYKRKDDEYGLIEAVTD